MALKTLHMHLSETTFLTVKKYAYLLNLIPLTVLFFVPYLSHLTGIHNGMAFIPLLVFFGLIPCLDALIGRDRFNPSTPAVEKKLWHGTYYRLLLLALVPLHFFIIFWAGNHIIHPNLNMLGQLGWIIGVGAGTAALGIAGGHELIHRKHKLDQYAGGLLLASVCYAGFKIEHIRGHHINVATPDDATSARYNQSLYHFLPRAYWHNIRAAFALESKRLQRVGKSWFSVQNELLWFYGFSMLLLATFAALWGWLGIFFFLGQAFVAFTMLETINYVEHYGLRRRLSHGKYEIVSPQHSWNSDHWLSNMLLYQVQRHSDHHANAFKPYQSLRTFDGVPQLPAGYPTMILIAFIPPLWFKIMNPRVQQWQKIHQA